MAERSATSVLPILPAPLSARAELLAGVRAELPILLGTTPFGLIYGVLATGAGLPPAAAIALSSVVFAGSAQFIAVQLFSAQAPAAILVLTTLVVNLRHLLYGTALAPAVAHLPARWKWLLAYLLTDEAFAVTITRYTRPDAEQAANKHWFFLGAGLTLWASWQLSTVAGVLVGAQVPASWGLDFTIALTFIALLIPAVRDRAGLAAALTAGVVAVAAYGLPLKLGLVAAALAGVAAGSLVEARRR